MFVDYKNIRVFYTPELEGGGMDFGQDYIPVVRKMFGKVDRCCEFGAGPGFIGFSLLAHGLCDSLTLVDINPAAVKMLRKTVKENHLEGRVRIYLSDGLRKVNKNEKWDLVVSNPPHFNGAEKRYTQDVRVYDPGWRIHKEFYSKAAKFLNRDGSILFVE
ncbi:MAG: methyltransferase, partial [Candidatus Micrarchaeota archaeon]|nr:methyltransferase [Candidatus Micrarchaeota archaeon]